MSSGCAPIQQIDRETPAGLTAHVIADHDATHKHGKVGAWLARRPRFAMHCPPTSGSWLNLVERFFADRAAVICAVSFAALRRGIARRLAVHHDNPRPCQ